MFDYVVNSFLDQVRDSELRLWSLYHLYTTLLSVDRMLLSCCYLLLHRVAALSCCDSKETVTVSWFCHGFLRPA